MEFLIRDDLKKKYSNCKIALISEDGYGKQSLNNFLEHPRIEVIELKTSIKQPTHEGEAIENIQEMANAFRERYNNYDLILFVQDYIKKRINEPHQQMIYIAMHDVSNGGHYIQESHSDEGVNLPDMDLFNNELFYRVDSDICKEENGFSISCSYTEKNNDVTYGELLCKKNPQYEPANNWMMHIDGAMDREQMIYKTLQRVFTKILVSLYRKRN